MGFQVSNNVLFVVVMMLMIALLIFAYVFIEMIPCYEEHLACQKLIDERCGFV